MRTKIEQIICPRTRDIFLSQLSFLKGDGNERTASTTSNPDKVRQGIRTWCSDHLHHPAPPTAKYLGSSPLQVLSLQFLFSSNSYSHISLSISYMIPIKFIAFHKQKNDNNKPLVHLSEFPYGLFQVFLSLLQIYNLVDYLLLSPQSISVLLMNQDGT